MNLVQCINLPLVYVPEKVSCSFVPLTPDPGDATVHVVWLMISEGWLSHAILDVFEKEPLPADSELWTHPQVTITPHVAGLYTNYQKVWDVFL